MSGGPDDEILRELQVGGEKALAESCARSVAAAWELSTRPCRNRWGGAWR